MLSTYILNMSKFWAFIDIIIESILAKKNHDVSDPIH